MYLYNAPTSTAVQFQKLGSSVQAIPKHALIILEVQIQ